MNADMIAKRIDEVLHGKWEHEKDTYRQHHRGEHEIVETFAGDVPNGTWFGTHPDMLRGGVMGARSTDPTLIKFSGHRGPGLLGVKSKVWVRRWTTVEPCECSTCQAVRDRKAFNDGTLKPDPALCEALESGTLETAPRKTALVDDKKPADVARARRLEELRERLKIDPRDMEGITEE